MSTEYTVQLINEAVRVSKPKITTEIIKRYYVQIDDWIYGGPFDTREQAESCLQQALSR